ncbi:MAG: flagellar biosynthesis anti-sigma factor FlgM [Thermomicrobium sp.]|nr:flagellar biosynthesis anti-sigma factor FlgM [Thermomicrobium sp.]MDW8059381.1 flagellar biosynthesis anti-sigma factor FlgM [Thermomicrobium sp.]
MVNQVGHVWHDPSIQRVESPEQQARQPVAPPARPDRPSQAAELTPELQEVQRAIEVVRQAPDVREGRVAAIKKLLEAGRYQAPLQVVADRVASDLRPTLDSE